MLIKSYIGNVGLYDCDNVSTVEDVIDFIRNVNNIPSCIGLKCQQNGRILAALSAPVSQDGPVSVLLSGGLPGGKGGFGSLLRSIGAQIEKTTNHEAMR